MPIGLQVVGPLRADQQLLKLSSLFERASGLLDQRPPLID
jgi:Asp-tRNA(Asn)/Glu-tRNA(Gln) amidotransferase A subunit family amidase